jgi:hypothetical protein
MHELAYTTVVKGKLFKFSFDVSDMDKPDRYTVHGRQTPSLPNVNDRIN